MELTLTEERITLTETRKDEPMRNLFGKLASGFWAGWVAEMVHLLHQLGEHGPPWVLFGLP